MLCMQSRKDIAPILKTVLKAGIIGYIARTMNRYLNPVSRHNIGKKRGGRKMYNFKVKFIMSPLFYQSVDNYLLLVTRIINGRKRSKLTFYLTPILQREFLKKLKKIYKQ